MSHPPLHPPLPRTYNQGMDRIDRILDETDRLEGLSGEEFVAEAARLGLVVNEKGVYADPHHPAREFLSEEETGELLRRRFERHGIEFSLED